MVSGLERAVPFEYPQHIVWLRNKKIIVLLRLFTEGVLNKFAIILLWKRERGRERERERERNFV